MGMSTRRRWTSLSTSQSSARSWRRGRRRWTQTRARCGASGAGGRWWLVAGTGGCVHVCRPGVPGGQVAPRAAARRPAGARCCQRRSTQPCCASGPPPPPPHPLPARPPARPQIRQLIGVLDMRKDEAIERTFKGVAKHFREVFAELVPGGRGELVMQVGRGRAAGAAGLGSRGGWAGWAGVEQRAGGWGLGLEPQPRPAPGCRRLARGCAGRQAPGAKLTVPLRCRAAEAQPRGGGGRGRGGRRGGGGRRAQGGGQVHRRQGGRCAAALQPATCLPTDDCRPARSRCLLPRARLHLTCAQPLSLPSHPAAAARRPHAPRRSRCRSARARR
jgi:hypothetical protein